MLQKMFKKEDNKIMTKDEFLTEIGKLCIKYEEDNTDSILCNVVFNDIQAYGFNGERMIDHYDYTYVRKHPFEE